MGIDNFAFHGPPRYRGKGIACKIRIGQIPLYSPQIAENDDVIILAGGQILLVQEFVDKVVAFFGKNALSIIQRNICLLYTSTINAIILGGSYDIDRKNIDKLINLRSYYKKMCIRDSPA